MAARRYVLEVDKSGEVHLPRLDLAPGTAVEVVVVPVGTDPYEDNPGLLCALLAQASVLRDWDTPEEDEAWKDLRPAK